MCVFTLHAGPNAESENVEFRYRTGNLSLCTGKGENIEDETQQGGRQDRCL